MSAQQVTITGPKWASLNGSHGHWSTENRLRQAWLTTAIVACRAARLRPAMEPVELTVTIHRTTNARSDAPNLAPTVKACTDALVRTGVLTDDNDRVIVRTITERGPNRDRPTVTLTIRPVA